MGLVTKPESITAIPSKKWNHFPDLKSETKILFSLTQQRFIPLIDEYIEFSSSIVLVNW